MRIASANFALHLFGNCDRMEDVRKTRNSPTKEEAEWSLQR